MVLAELSYFYRQLCAKEIMIELMQKLEKKIPVLLCKMELDRTSSAWWKSNTTNDYGDMTYSSLYTRSNK
jgi:hypothetical protein